MEKNKTRTTHCSTVFVYSAHFNLSRKANNMVPWPPDRSECPNDDMRCALCSLSAKTKLLRTSHGFAHRVSLFMYIYILILIWPPRGKCLWCVAYRLHVHPACRMNTWVTSYVGHSLLSTSILRACTYLHAPHILLIIQNTHNRRERQKHTNAASRISSRSATQCVTRFSAQGHRQEFAILDMLLCKKTA